MIVHNAAVDTHSRTRSRALWLNGLIVGIGTVVMAAGADHLAVIVDNFAIVLAHIGLVLTIEFALLLLVKRLV